MYSETDIDGAVEAGALSADAAASFRGHVAATRAMSIADEESFRLLTGFNDIFVSIAAVLMLVATGWIGNAIRIGAPEHGPSPMLGFAVAITAWLLAEYFTRVRRMALPSIILLLGFAGGIFVGFGVAMIPDGNGENDRVVALLSAATAAVTAIGVFFHWRRFHVPITIAAGAAALAGVVVSLLVAAIPPARDQIHSLVLVAGVAVFALAMWWDISDRARITRRSDVAFWLHLLAAPMIVHPIFTMLGLLDQAADPARAAIVILLYVLLGLVALAIDRRALMVSALAYVLVALSSLIEQTGVVNLAFGLTALIIGSALLLLSAFWQSARSALVTRLPAALVVKLPVADRVAIA